MKKIKALLVIFVLLFSFGSPVFATGMPVIDVSAIAQAVSEAVQEVNRWNQQIQQWKSEYDRIMKAAQNIASGDFVAIVNGVASLADQMGGWAEYADMPIATEVFTDTKDGAVSLLSTMTNAKILLANYDYLTEAIETNITRMQEEYKRATNSLDKSQSIGNGVFATGTGVLNLVSSLLKNGGNTLTSGLKLANSVADIFYTSPETVAQLYDNVINEMLKSRGLSSIGDIDRQIASLRTQKNTIEEERSKYNPKDNAQAVNDIERQEKSIDEQISDLEAMKSNIEQLQKSKAEVQAQQDWYSETRLEKATQEAEKTRTEAYANGRKLAEQSVQTGLSDLEKNSATFGYSY